MSVKSISAPFLAVPVSSSEPRSPPPSLWAAVLSSSPPQSWLDAGTEGKLENLNTRWSPPSLPPPQCYANSETCCRPEARRELPGCTCDVVIMWRAKQCCFFVCLLFGFVLLVLFLFIYLFNFPKVRIKLWNTKKKSSLVSLQISIFFFAKFLFKKMRMMHKGSPFKMLPWSLRNGLMTCLALRCVEDKL